MRTLVWFALLSLGSGCVDRALELDDKECIAVDVWPAEQAWTEALSYDPPFNGTRFEPAPSRCFSLTTTPTAG
jgi:hypothetical protein